MSAAANLERVKRRAKRAAARQKPGCLPQGFTRDSLLLKEEFCVWQRVQPEWFEGRAKYLPGVVGHSTRHLRIHVGTYLDGISKQNS